MSIGVSFEFFPPKTADMEETLWRAVRRLAPLRPRFVSVTYGAGGSTRERTHATVKRILEETDLHPAAHLTCVGAPKAEIDAVIRDYWAAGVRHIVALRGDMPPGVGGYHPHQDGYASTSDLIRAIRRIGDFEVSVSAYPEKHPDSASLDADVEVLKEKVAAGATRAITQFCFTTEAFPRLRDRVRKAGLDIPIIPGLMPTTNFKGVSRMAERCGAAIPAWLAERFEGLDEDLDTRKLIAATVAADQVAALRREGFDQFHFYTLNQADLTYAICRILGLKPVS
jgi:methylenetetrahydrofolate reductase (NADPH)